MNPARLLKLYLGRFMEISLIVLGHPTKENQGKGKHHHTIIALPTFVPFLIRFRNLCN